MKIKMQNEKCFILNVDIRVQLDKTDTIMVKIISRAYQNTKIKIWRSINNNTYLNFRLQPCACDFEIGNPNNLISLY